MLNAPISWPAAVKRKLIIPPAFLSPVVSVVHQPATPSGVANDL